MATTTSLVKASDDVGHAAEVFDERVDEPGVSYAPQVRLQTLVTVNTDGTTVIAWAQAVDLPSLPVPLGAIALSQDLLDVNQQV